MKKTTTNKTTLIVRDAMSSVSKEVRKPKILRDMDNLTTDKVKELVHLNMIMKKDCPIKIQSEKAHEWLIDFIMYCNKSLIDEMSKLRLIEKEYNLKHLKRR